MSTTSTSEYIKTLERNLKALKKVRPYLFISSEYIKTLERNLKALKKVRPYLFISVAETSYVSGFAAGFTAAKKKFRKDARE